MIDDHSIDEFPIELLAAYVDGELGAAARLRVERWLADHPEALSELFDQEGLAPANEDYWRSVAPPMPSDAAWDRVLNGIEASASPASRHRETAPRTPRAIRFLAPAALSSLAAVVLIALLTVDRQRPGEVAVPHGQPQAAPVAQGDRERDDFVFQVATADDVDLLQLPEEATDLLVVGRHPLNGVALVFADSMDVQVLNYGLDDQGEVADYQTMRGPDTPMFVAPPRKR